MVVLAVIGGYLGSLFTTFNTWVCIIRKRWGMRPWARVLEVRGCNQPDASASCAGCVQQLRLEYVVLLLQHGMASGTHQPCSATTCCALPVGTTGAMHCIALQCRLTYSRVVTGHCGCAQPATCAISIMLQVTSRRDAEHLLWSERTPPLLPHHSSLHTC
jgi:hypothetical protein